MTEAALLYIFGPPIAALVLAGAISLGGNLRTRRLDRMIGRDAKKAGIHLVEPRPRD